MKKLKKLKLGTCNILKEDEMKKVTGGYSGGWYCEYYIRQANVYGSGWSNARWDTWADDFERWCS